MTPGHVALGGQGPVTSGPRSVNTRRSECAAVASTTVLCPGVLVLQKLHGGLQAKASGPPLSSAEVQSPVTENPGDGALRGMSTFSGGWRDAGRAARHPTCRDPDLPPWPCWRAPRGKACCGLVAAHSLHSSKNQGRVSVIPGAPAYGPGRVSRSFVPELFLHVFVTAHLISAVATADLRGGGQCHHGALGQTFPAVEGARLSSWTVLRDVHLRPCSPRGTVPVAGWGWLRPQAPWTDSTCVGFTDKET